MERKRYIGTSGWMYKDWARDLYPEGMKRGHLSFFAKEFKTVEVNSSFYHLPLKKTFEKWNHETPDDFVFSIKLSRFITHQKRLRGTRGALERFMRHARPLQKKIGAILVQLPPSLAYEERLLRTFLEDIRVVSGRNYVVPFAFEPRHQSWFSKEHLPRIAMLFKNAGIAMVFANSAAIPSIKVADANIFSNLVYIRFHGPQAFASSPYKAARLRVWADRITSWERQGHAILTYFNNDVHGYAIHDARTLIRQCRRREKRSV